MNNHKTIFNAIAFGGKDAGMYETELRELCDKYPWFTFGKVALIKSLQTKGEIKEASKIRRSIAISLMSFNYSKFLNPPRRLLLSSNTTTKVDSLKVIDNFLSTPIKRITPISQESEFEEVDLAEENSSKTDVISENLAIIYEKQGHFDKSIDIYHKLILIYPEKNAYFASRIESIEAKKAN